MPKSESLELPAFLSALSEDLQPTRPAINRLVFPSPLKEWPGTVTMPCYLSAAEYHQWWTGAGEGQSEDDERHWLYFEWETRFSLAKKWDLEGLDNDQLQADPINLPDLRIAMWFMAITQPIIVEATSLPNSRRPSNDIETMSKKLSMAIETKEA